MKALPKKEFGGKHLSCGVRIALFEKEHREKMHEAVYLFCWLIGRQTVQKNGIGLVLRGRPLTYAEIAGDMHESPNTVRKWLDRLRKHGYVKVKYGAYMKMRIYVMKAKKWTDKQLSISFGNPVQKPVENEPSEGGSTRPLGVKCEDHRVNPMGGFPLSRNGKGESVDGWGGVPVRLSEVLRQAAEFAAKGEQDVEEIFEGGAA